MALHWLWSQKMGEATVLSNGKEFTLDLYEGNAYLIFIHNYEEDGKKYYNLWSFFADRQHMLNCLGLTKGSDSIFTADSARPIDIKISIEHTKALEITHAFIRWSKKYNLDITMHIVPPYRE